jgi:GAF domain-containing protein
MEGIAVLDRTGIPVPAGWRLSLRTEVRPFTQSEIELIETFADQA